MRARARAIILSLGLALPVLALASQASTGCAFRTEDDCTLTLGFGCTPAMASSTSTATGTGGVSNSTSTSGGGTTATTTGGSGGVAQCMDASTCPAVPPGPCASLGTVTCVKGKCGVSYGPTATGGDAPSQKYGSCQKTVCDANGTATDIEYDANVYDDGNPCTTESCAGGIAGEVARNTGSSCTVMGLSGFCEQDPYSGNIACLPCDPNVATTCAGSPGTSCVKGYCVPLSCSDTVKDNGETDLNCGGGQCLRCGTNKTCSTYLDCISQVCTAGKCAAESCSDNVQNQDETDKDCGGVKCGTPCGNNLKCLVANDCLSLVCKASTSGAYNTCQVPTCTDGVQNGDETGLDCGSPTIPMCPPCP